MYKTKTIQSLCLIVLWLCITASSTAQQQAIHRSGSPTMNERLFIYQGPYDSLGSVEAIAALLSNYGYVVMTHGFYLPSGTWSNGSCLDVNYSRMPELLIQAKNLNPSMKIFCYVPATADHPNGCWPIPSVVLNECPSGNCRDFKLWTDMWCGLETLYTGLSIDGIFIDLAHPALIGGAVRDSIFSYVKLKKKLIMANALSDTFGVKFVLQSSQLTPEDIIFVEGFHTIAGYPNTQTTTMTSLLGSSGRPWAALMSEAPSSTIDCSNSQALEAYEILMHNGGIAFAYQSSDLGTQSYHWDHCPITVVAVPPKDPIVPSSENIVLLYQNYPNPFNASTVIRYHIVTPAHVRVRVFNVLGQQIAVVADQYQNSGNHSVTYDSAALPSGVYTYVVETEMGKASKIMTVIK